MARIKTYAIDATPTIEDKVIGTNVDDANLTQNYKIGDIIALVPGGSSSVQSLNTLTGDVNLVAGTNISLAVDASKKEIEISSTGGAGGITSIEGATGPAIDLAGKGGITVTAVGNLINIDGSGISGGAPGAPFNGIQVNNAGSFGAYDYLISNPVSKTLDLGNGSIGKVGSVEGIVNLFNATGEERDGYGSVRFYDFISNTNYVGIIGPGSMEKVSYNIALPDTEPTRGQVMSVKQNQTATPWELEWTSPSGGGGGGTVTDVSVSVNPSPADSIGLRVFDSTTTPRIELDFNGVVGQYINGAGELENFNAMTTLTTTGTSGAATYDSSTNTLNVPNYAGGTTSPAGVAGSVQINDGTNFSADTNLTWDTTNNILTVGNERNPVFQEGILLLKGNGSNLGGRVQFQTGIGKAAAAIVTLQGPEAGVKQEISLPGALPSDIGLALTVKSITGTEVETEWRAAGGGGGTVTSVGGTAPIVSSGGNTPSLSIGESSESVDGYLSSTNFSAFKGKQAALVSGTNIKSINGNSLLGSGDLVIGSSATPGGSDTQIQYNNSSVLDGNVSFTLDTVTSGLTKVQIGKSDNPTNKYGVLRLEGNGTTEGGKIELETGASKGSPETIILQAPDAGAAQEISLPETLPTADTQVLGIKSINGTSVQTQWETPTGGGTSLPYTSYEATYSIISGTIRVVEANNTTGRTFAWIDNGTDVTIRISSTFGDKNVLVLLNGFGGKTDGFVQCFFNGYDKASGEISIVKLDQSFTPQPTDITQGNLEFRVY